jgi:hypothetical protein
MSGPMDPERLDVIRREVLWKHDTHRRAFVMELLADRDYWAAEAAQWKAAAKLLQRTHETTMEALSDLADSDNDQSSAQASLDAAAHAQLEGQHAAAYGGATLSEVAALEGIEAGECPSCAQVVRLDPDGKITTHAPRGANWAMDPGERQPRVGECPGSGEAPAVVSRQLELGT